MDSVQSSVRSLMQMFDAKAREFTSVIDNVHMVWLEEIQQEANHMFTRDFNAEPELMPKTPSQKKNSRRKRVSVGHQEENQARRRFSKGRRSNLRGTTVKSLNFIAEEANIPEPSTSEANTSTPPKRATRATRKNKQTVSEVAEDVSQSHGSCKTEDVQNKKPVLVQEEEKDINNKVKSVEDEMDFICSPPESPPTIPSPEIVVRISPSDRLSAEFAERVPPSPGRSAAKIAIAGVAQGSRRSSVRCSLKLRHSLAGLRHSMTQESVRRASRRSMLKRKVTCMLNATCSSIVDEEVGVNAEEKDREAVLDTVSAETEDNAAAEEWKEVSPEINQSIRPSVGRITRSVTANTAVLASPSLCTKEQTGTPNKRTVAEKRQTSQSDHKSRQSTKRKAPDTVEESPTKRHSPPKKSQSKNRLLMETPNSLGRTAVIKSFIKHTTPLKIDGKLSAGVVTKERHKLEALKRKQELEEERMKKMEEDKKKRQDEVKRKRDERLRRVYEAKVKEEQKEVEKKKKIEQKMAQIDEKNDKRQADEKAKKKVAIKRQEELEQKKKLEEEAKRKKMQQAEEEKWQQELLAKKKAEEEEQRARKLAEARKALELEREQLAAAERERAEKALALRAAREKERRELEEKTKALEKKLEEQQRLAAEEKAAKEREAAAAAAAKKAALAQVPSCLNVTVDIESSVLSTPVGKGGLNMTVDIEKSPQSYSITPKGGNKPMSKIAEDYGMDQNSDDSTDDESAPRKPIPSWAEGHNLQQHIMKQYFNPLDLDSLFGTIEPPKLEKIFYKSKPRYFKRTSSAVWHSPPIGSK